MAIMRINFGIQIEETPINTEYIQPQPITLMVGGENLRRTVTLPAENAVTLDTGEITPKWWYLQNVHESADLVVSFGGNDDMIFSPGEFGFFRSGTVLVARGVEAESKLLYGVYA